MPFAALHRELEARAAQGLLRARAVVRSPQSVHLEVDGRTYLSFCSNDYLGLANDPRVVDALKAGAEKYGAGAGASHLVSGHFYPHHLLEEQLADFVNKPAALLFSTGYLANLGAIGALAGRNDAIFADKLNHASLNDAMLLARAEVRRYRHNDAAHLEELLRESKGQRKLVVTDAVFSMDGDVAPVADLLALCERYDAWLYVDDAHGFGVLGHEGRGSAFQFTSPRLIYMATLGKAAGVSGAFVAAEKIVVDTLLQHARPYVYTTASPPALAHALSASLELIKTGEWRRENLRARIAQLRAGLAALPWKLMDSDTPIQPLVVGGNEDAVHLNEALKTKNIWVPAIRPPTVPQGTARLRISLSALHSEADVAQLIEALHAAH